MHATGVDETRPVAHVEGASSARVPATYPDYSLPEGQAHWTTPRRGPLPARLLRGQKLTELSWRRP